MRITHNIHVAYDIAKCGEMESEGTQRACPDPLSGIIISGKPSSALSSLRGAKGPARLHTQINSRCQYMTG
jgi:hypothetical protein